MSKYRIISKFSNLYKKKVIAVQKEIAKSYPNPNFYYDRWVTIKNKKKWFFGIEEEKTFDTVEEAEKYIIQKKIEEEKLEDKKTVEVIKNYT